MITYDYDVIIIGAGSEVIHSLSQASASGVYVANQIINKINHYQIRDKLGIEINKDYSNIEG